MARRYTRDNRGRFASAGGGGATARGGRLRTASGKKRATQTMKAASGGGDGVIRGRTARTVAGQMAMGKLAKRPEQAKPAAKATGAGRRVGGASSTMKRQSQPSSGGVLRGYQRDLLVRREDQGTTDRFRKLKGGGVLKQSTFMSPVGRGGRMAKVTTNQVFRQRENARKEIDRLTKPARTLKGPRPGYPTRTAISRRLTKSQGLRMER